MKTYAYVRGNVVISHFTTNRPRTDAKGKPTWPDIDPYLVEAPEDIQDGDFYDGDAAFLPQEELATNGKWADIKAALDSLK